MSDWPETADDLLCKAHRALIEERDAIEREYMVRHAHLVYRMNLLMSIMDVDAPTTPNLPPGRRAHRAHAAVRHRSPLTP